MTAEIDSMDDYKLISEESHKQDTQVKYKIIFKMSNDKSLWGWDSDALFKRCHKLLHKNI
jgi:hypothetical protein